MYSEEGHETDSRTQMGETVRRSLRRLQVIVVGCDQIGLGRYLASFIVCGEDTFIRQRVLGP